MRSRPRVAVGDWARQLHRTHLNAGGVSVNSRDQPSVERRRVTCWRSATSKVRGRFASRSTSASHPWRRPGGLQSPGRLCAQHGRLAIHSHASPSACYAVRASTADRHETISCSLLVLPDFGVAKPISGQTALLHAHHKRPWRFPLFRRASERNGISS